VRWTALNRALPSAAPTQPPAPLPGHLAAVLTFAAEHPQQLATDRCRGGHGVSGRAVARCDGVQVGGGGGSRGALALAGAAMLAVVGPLVPRRQLRRLMQSSSSIATMRAVKEATSTRKTTYVDRKSSPIPWMANAAANVADLEAAAKAAAAKAEEGRITRMGGARASWTPKPPQGRGSPARPRAAGPLELLGPSPVRVPVEPRGVPVEEVRTARTLDPGTTASDGIHSEAEHLRTEAESIRVRVESLRTEVLDERTNAGFMFLKPHANTEAALELMRQRLGEAGIKVTGDGNLRAECLDKRRIIDVHYGSLAAKALDLSPCDLAVRDEAQAEFQARFGLSWQKALDEDLACNALEALERLNISKEELNAKWEILQIGVDKVKFGGGFYCGHIDNLFVINGFYMSMREMYTKPGRSVHWFAVEWDSDKLSWEEFRKDFLGDTDPATAASSSLRGQMHRNWKKLGLPGPPHVGENAVHASASSFEALVERNNWLSSGISDDPFGRALLDRGVSEETLRRWAHDPVLEYRGRQVSVFDLFENLDSRECLDMASDIDMANL